MYNAGDYVVYKNNGVCVIDGIRSEKFGKMDRQDFYVLRLIYENGSVVYVPVSKEEAEHRMRTPITRDRALELIENMPSADSSWIFDDKIRVAKSKEILDSGEPEKLIALVKALYQRGGELSEAGRKLRTADEAIMKKAENNLYGELAFALDINPSEVIGYITGKLQ